MANIPVNISKGVVTGQFLVGVADSADADTIPDAFPARGTITFTPSIKLLRNPSGSPNAQTIILRPIVAVLDTEGYLCTNIIDPVTSEYQRDVSLISTNVTGVSPTNWTWKVDYQLTYNGANISGPSSHSMQLEPNQTVDLTLVAPVTESGGIITLQGPAGPQGPAGSGGSGGTGLPSGGTALQLVRKDAANTGYEWITPTKSMVGLANVDNTSDANKPVSTATSTALSGKSNIGHSHTLSEISDASTLGRQIASTATAASGRTLLGLGNVDNTSDASKPVSADQQAALNLKAPLASPAFTGTPTGITKTHVGLGNVDNTSDANKPVSSATQTALNLKQDASSLLETVQDNLANSFLVAGTNVTLTYNDTANTLTITAAGGAGGGLDAEAVRDTIGTALVASGIITITVNDAGDTITIGTTATATGTSLVTATDAAAARSAIGAGTSSLALGTTSTTAKAGNYTPGFTDAVAGTEYHVYWTGSAWPARPTSRTDLVIVWTAPRSVTAIPADKVNGRDIREFSGD